MNSLTSVSAAVISVVSLVASAAKDYEPVVSRKGVLPDHIANSEGLVHGAEFQDLILPLPAEGMTSDTWGADTSKPRSLKWGIEDPEWSYWGGNPFLGNDGKYHCFVARWEEAHPRGHMAWGGSFVAHAIADDPIGPWKVLGNAYPYLNSSKGHNPEIQRLKDGRWCLWLNRGHIHATETDDINGKWMDVGKIKASRDHHPISRISANPSVVIRTDGSIYFCSRTGCMGIVPSGDPKDPVEGVAPKRFPWYKGGAEDPTIWKTGHQYHLIYNFWQVRLAVKMRSHDGINWELDPGVAYTENAEKYTDGTVVNWYKAERPKIVQDRYGRATQLALAMIDVVKKQDKGNDNHSSKHITLPIIVEGRTEILNQEILGPETDEVAIKLLAEEGSSPITDVDVESLRFGDPREVNYGRGGAPVASKADGNNLVVTFRGRGFGITEDSFTGKIIGKRTDGSVYYAYPRLPGFVDDPAVLVALPFKCEPVDGATNVNVRIKNYGLETSKPVTFNLTQLDKVVGTAKVPALKPYEQTELSIAIHHGVGRKNPLQGSFFPKYQIKR